MNSIYSKIEELNIKDPASHEARLGKLTEETGEVATAINKLTGRKALKIGDNEKTIADEILHEGADVIQNVISIVAGFGFAYDDLIQAMIEKNLVWETVLKIKEIRKLFDTVYSQNKLFISSGVTKNNGEFVLVFYWKAHFEDMHLMPPFAEGIQIKHIVVEEIKV